MVTPLAHRRLPCGAVQPRGWLGAELRRAASGLTGRLMDVWPDVGHDSAWLGGDGECWERGPYYVRGLVATAYASGDPSLVELARPWLDWTLGSQRDDGAFGPAANDDWWARMPMVDALQWHGEATGDARVAPFVARYLAHMRAALPGRPLESWARARGGDAMQHALWLYDRAPDPALLALVDLLREQTVDWTAELSAEVPSDAFELAHGVNRAMGLRLPAALARRTGDPGAIDVARRGWERTLAHHGQIQGSFSCDEMLHGTSPAQGTELCTVVELLHTLLALFEVRGDAWCADAFERLAYNALPAMIGPDGCTRQYFALANQVACTPGPHRFWYHHDTDLLFGVATGYGCCTANMHLGWPTVVRSLWLASADGGLVAPLFAPCAVTAVAGDDARVRIVEETAFPFDERVRMAIELDRPAAFPLRVRIPAWAAGATVAVGGEVLREGSAGMVTLARTWHDGDVVEITLPSPVRVTPWPDGVGVERGALVYALAVGEQWRRVAGTPPFADWELHATTPWNWGLIAADAVRARVGQGAVGPAPWTPAGAPIRLRAAGRLVHGWDFESGSAAPPPARPEPGGPPAPIELVPFGSARLRVAVFPVL